VASRSLSMAALLVESGALAIEAMAMCEQPRLGLLPGKNFGRAANRRHRTATSEQGIRSQTKVVDNLSTNDRSPNKLEKKALTVAHPRV